MPLGSKRNVANRHQPANAKTNQDACKSMQAEMRSRHGKGQANGVATPVMEGENVADGKCETKPPALGRPTLHVVCLRLPDLPCDGPIAWETYLLVFLLTAVFLQNFNIYHTSVYLANRDLFFFTTVLFIHRLMWTFSHHASFGVIQSQMFLWIRDGVKWFLISTQVVLLIWFLIRVLQNNSITNCLFLSYPVFLYFSLFGFMANPGSHHPVSKPLVLSDSPANTLLATAWSRTSSTDLYVIKPTVPCAWSSPEKLNGPNDGKCMSEYDVTVHLQCNYIPSPEAVRNDVNLLLADFSCRLKQLVFNSIVCTYYAAFLPVQFIQQDYVTYNKIWCYKHVAFIWAHTFVMLTMQLMPTSYCMSLYKYAKHLGSWRRVDKETAPHIWSPAKIWPPDTFVRYAKGVFEAQGIQVAAEPGDTGHAQFYFVFNEPTMILNCLLVIQSAALLYELVLLARATAWQQAVSVSVLVLLNYYPTYKIVRDRLALGRYFTQESY